MKKSVKEVLVVCKIFKNSAHTLCNSIIGGDLMGHKERLCVFLSEALHFNDGDDDDGNDEDGLMIWVPDFTGVYEILECNIMLHIKYGSHLKTRQDPFNYTKWSIFGSTNNSTSIGS